MGRNFLFVTLFSIFLVSIASVNAYSINAATNKITYAINDPLTITGTVNTSGTASISMTVYDSVDTVMDASSTSSSGGDQNTFSISSTINTSYSPGNYLISLISGTDAVNLSIRVVSQSISLYANSINSGDDVINVSTSTSITTANALGGNFTELLSLSKSGTKTLHYGNYSIGGKVYHFVLVDQNNATVYDRLYVDDDSDFRLFNDTEDSDNDVEYQALKRGSMFSNGTFRYIIGEIERTTGNEIIFWNPPTGRPPYASSDTVKFIVIAKNDTHLLPQAVSVDLLNATGQNITPSNIYSTNNFGWVNASISLPSVAAGIYTISLNGSIGIMPFPVEAFKLFATISDLSNNPTSGFAPNSQVRITIISMNASGTINLTSFTVTTYYPDGSTSSKIESDFTQVTDGIYRYDFDLTGAPTGRYSMSITGSDGTNSQTVSTGFEVQSVSFEAMAINTRYIEESEGGEAMVNAFAPNTNVTIMTFLSNISAGGIMAKGPEGFEGLLSPGDCNSTVTLTKVRDESGDSYSVNYVKMNLSDALNYLHGELPADVPQDFLNQCMIIFSTPSKNGIYTAEVKINYQGEERYSGVAFGVQRLWAEGGTVDSKGDDFGFFAPNSTVRIKLGVTDLATDEELDAGNITSAKIIELYKVFPSFKDILANSTLRNILNEGVVNGTINFTSPNDEGFYAMKFRFTADIDGGVETGIGDAFFMLKKYMVWGNLAGAQEGQWFIKQGENITLSVTVLDIDKAQTYFGGYNSQKTCTGCGGFTISVSELRNDQQFKKVTGYTVQTGTITNTTNPIANVTIVPTQGTDMQTGWYSIDLVVTDPSTNSTYFGWGGFEIRNFWVDIQKVDWNGTHYLLSEGDKGGATYAVGQSASFTVIPRVPFSPEILQPTSKPSVESIQWFEGWPPVSLSGYTTSVSNSPEQIFVCYPEKCEVTQAYVITISDLPTDKKGNFQVNVKVNTTNGTDIGSFWFSISTYDVNAAYRMGSWPPMFSNTENLTVNFTAFDFDKNPYNITNVTIGDFFDNKKGRPIKMRYGQNYTTVCDENFCKVDVFLTNLQSGEYNARFTIVDEEENEKTEDVYFKVQDVVVSIPTIEEAGIWENEQISKKVEQNIWRTQWSRCQERYGLDRNEFTDATFLCGEATELCEGECESFPYNITAPNVSYSKEIFGYVPLIEGWAIGRFGSVANKSSMYMYANGTHMWINITPDMLGEKWADLRGTTPIAVGGIFADDKGGIWRLDAIGDPSITITGLTTLYRTGILINTSYSRSGVFKLGQIEERNLGAFTQEGRSGIDLNGNGLTEDNLYFAISDNAVSGVYDTFFFSTDGNFTGEAAPGTPNPISLNELNRTKREFGTSSNSKDRLTLLSIDPRAQNLKFYSRQVGDWAHMGDIKFNNNITIPIIVTSPDGSPRSVFVSITGYKNMRNFAFTNQNLVTNLNITGIGEIKFNSSLVGKGEFAFAIRTNDVMEEWKWPMATIRGYLVDGETGESMYISNFKQLPIREFNGDNLGGSIERIQQDARNDTPGYIIDGVLFAVSGIQSEGCQVYNVTGNITDEILQQSENYAFLGDYGQDNNGFFFYNSTSETLYRNPVDCWFNVSATPTYRKGNSLSINRNGRTYNVTVLTVGRDVYDYRDWVVNNEDFNANECRPLPGPITAIYSVSNVSGPVPPSAYNWTSSNICINNTGWFGVYDINYQRLDISWRADFGVPGVNSSIILPMINNPFSDPNWRIAWSYMQNVSIFGTYYDVILANDTYNYQRCLLETWDDGHCAKKAWFVRRSIGNFSDSSAIGVIPGQNYTRDLYLASVGPRDGEGITVGNFTDISTLGLPQLPIIAGINMEFANITRFSVLNEATLNYDLDKDGGKNRTYYMLLFDSDFNGQQALSHVIMDDDLQIVTWNFDENPIDFNGSEVYNGANFDEINRTDEKWGDLPSGIRNGNVRFGDDYDVQNRPWELQPSWDVPFFNTTHMLLRKSEWRVSDTSQPVDLLLKVYNFDQSAIQGASVSITQIARSSWAGFQVLSQSDYTITRTSNVTDSYGYNLLKISPSGTWNAGQYQVLASIQAPQGTETFERWFCLGSCGW
jgi:hypothetical protein